MQRYKKNPQQQVPPNENRYASAQILGFIYIENNVFLSFLSQSPPFLHLHFAYILKTPNNTIPKKEPMLKNAIIAFSFLIASFATTSHAQESDPYIWPDYNPTLNYNFKELHPDLEEPLLILDDCPEVVGEISDGWWTFRWGPDRNPSITDNAIHNMLDRLNKDFAYFRDEMGWPPDARAKNGYKSAVYLYGSGLCTDNASNTAEGGWQGNIFHDGRNWPMILASYIPIRAFDPQYNDGYQMGAMVHEGIHALLADLPGAKQAAWFHEGGNVWLQQTADARRSGDYSQMGFLNAAALIAPFMPIECYSGWLQDGSFGGPSAEGVNMSENGKQICTWRNLLGGTQYGSMFPTVLAQILGDGSIPWIWANCPERILEGMSKGLGDEQTRHLIVQYRAKLALLDMGEWTKACINLLNGNFGGTIDEEWEPSWLQPEDWTATPYAATTQNGTTLTPNKLTLPGWSGSNIIPLTISGDSVTVDFQPIGQNMTCQLAYRTTQGKPVYSRYVSEGKCSLRLDAPAANNVVFAVITNTDYIYKGESTRTAKYDYRLSLIKGISGTADINKRWYESAQLIDLTTYVLTASVSGGGGNVTPDSRGFLVGDTATISASDEGLYSFSYWSGDASGSDNPLKIAMNENKTVIANFIKKPSFLLTVSTEGSGSVNPTGGEFAKGSTQRLKAEASAGYFFSHWAGDIEGTNNPIEITMDSEKSVIAVFKAIPATVLEYNISMNPMQDYTAVSIEFDADTIAQTLGLSRDQIVSGMGSSVSFYAINPDGSHSTQSTAKPPGHWFSNTGEVVPWGDNSFIYSELDIETLTANVGQFPYRCVLNDHYTIIQALESVMGRLIIKINISIGDNQNTQTIELQKGWNLISINRLPAINTIESIFNGLDVALIKNMDSFWSAGQQAEFNSLNILEPGKGYMVYLNSGGELEITGDPINSDNFPHEQGSSWQIIGCPYQEEVQFTDVFNNLSIIKNFSGFWQSGGQQNSIDRFITGEAYFIRTQ